ncbi:hypothetical protein H5410_049335 [Solanum commersonii]|uniref:Uncharacterized protein n=1 Tax=Solanum commersonii TaxID=4109 RepID=A0A9J5WUC1_SOLCO|nr:hypothetical protein H5410_049335 [Solanum commersonii]
MSLDRCACHDLCHQANARRPQSMRMPRPMSTGRCAHATAYVDWSMCACHGLCCLADARLPWLITSGRCMQATANVA